MKNVTFYLEYKSEADKKNSSIRTGKIGNHMGNCIAMLSSTPRRKNVYN